MAKSVGILGATSFVGQCLLPRLVDSGWSVKAFSRSRFGEVSSGIAWYRCGNDSRALTSSREVRENISHWICLTPVWVVPEYFELLEAHGARRVLALSSTSRFTKADSSDINEQAGAYRLAEGEERLQRWAREKDMEWVILRPTLIYGRGCDRNICEIARFIDRFGFFPLFGEAKGLRQPIHAEDVAAACHSALETPRVANCAYNISGGETMPYRNMVSRVFSALGRRPRFVQVPLSVFKLGIFCLRALPRYKNWTAGMLERMNRDLAFDHGEAARDLSFSPRPFRLMRDDLPV